MHEPTRRARSASASYRRRCSKYAVALVAACMLALPTSRLPAQIAVIDAAAVAKLVSQIQKQVQQITITKQQLQIMIQNMKKLSGPQWRAIAGTLNQVDALTQQGVALWYSLASIDAQFQQTFPGWKLTGTMPNDLRVQQERTLATLRSAVDMANVTSQQLAVANARLTAMKGQLGGLNSAQAAAELTGVIGIHTAEEITLLRQQLAAQGNAQAVFLAHQVNRDTQGAAAADAFRTAGATTPVRPKNMTVAAVGIP
jgi:P-type conjugative transfer protein TrbJ